MNESDRALRRQARGEALFCCAATGYYFVIVAAPRMVPLLSWAIAPAMNNIRSTPMFEESRLNRNKSDEKLPPLAHVVCGWPLLLVIIGGAVGGGLGGLAYGINVAIYKSRLPLT